MLTKEEARIVVNIHDLLPEYYYLGKLNDNRWCVKFLKRRKVVGTLQEVYIWAKGQFNEDELPFK